MGCASDLKRRERASHHPEDEDNPAELLIQEGLEEADHDQRVSAAREQSDEE